MLLKESLTSKLYYSPPYNNNTDCIRDVTVGITNSPSILEQTHLHCYRDIEDSFHSDTHTSSMDDQAEAVGSYDSTHHVPNGTHLNLCKGLFGLHIKRGRGRPRKFTNVSMKKNHNNKKKAKLSTRNVQSNNTQSNIRTDSHNPNTSTNLELVSYDPSVNNLVLATNILKDTVDMGLKPTCSEELAIQNIMATL